MSATIQPPDNPDPRERRRFYDAGGENEAVFTFRRLDPPNYRVTTQFDYVDQWGHSYRVPVDVADNHTDLASIPFFLTWLVPVDGSHTPAAVLHDALIGGSNGMDYSSPTTNMVPDRHADYLMREAMETLEVAWIRRWLIWAAVALRSLTVLQSTGGKRWLRIVPVAIVAIGWAVISAWMALDVPGLLRYDWGLPWLDDQTRVPRVGLGLVTIAVGAVATSLFFGLVTWSNRGLSAGLIAGIAIGFLGLPMIAALVGFLIYAIPEFVLGKIRNAAG